MNDRSSALHERYEELSTLGRGGAGTVYLVRDRDTGDRLALKRLLRADEESLLRLKREFRALAGISHPNLVKLFELGQDETSAYFTMEYLAGEDLRQHLEMDAHGTEDNRLSLKAASANDNDNDSERGQVARVLSAFEQLATGVRALHGAGVLHRDLKPSNVMVSDGRVVVLDFGIALEVGARANTITHDKLSFGTPAYVAPEQASGSHVGEANDWYAFGAMLYEALSGVLPIEGKLSELLQRKRTHAPQPISELVPAVPNDVAELCMRLLRPKPEERPSGDHVLSVLRAHTGRISTQSQDTRLSLTPTTRSQAEADHTLFGREHELAALWAAFRTTQEGGSAAVHVFGESGAGKSLLLHHFSDEVAREGFSAMELQPLVLRSRCYERETLAFKALDAAMDALVSQLSREPDLMVSHAMPRNLLALTQLFPVLKSLRVTRQLLALEKLPVAMSQMRAQAELAFSDLLTRQGQQRPVVLWFDDLQWGDLDSIGIISSWLKPPHIPGLMLVFSYRSEEIATSPALRMLRQSANPSIELQIPLQLLGEEHVRALCTQRFERAHWPAPARARVIDRIVLEAEGSPFLASQLAALAIAQPNTGDEQLARLTLEELVRSRSQSLSDGARSVLNVLSMAGRPIPLALAMRASGVLREARACVHELQSLHLIRTRDSAGERLLEVYHGRLREVVVSLLAPEERAAIDRRLLSSLRETNSTDCDWLHALALALDARADALHYGLQAAARASEKLAFERAAELYERCIELSPDPSANDGELWQKLALSYSYAGHGSKAANTYLHAAQHVSAEQRLLFERAATSQLICSGRFDEGEALLASVLERLDQSAPESELGLYAAIGWERTRLMLRGLSYTPRPRSEIPFLTFFTAEFCGLLSIETVSYHPLRSALFQARCLRLALNLGGDEDVARALCAAATMTSVEASERAQLRAEELLVRAEAIERQIDSSLVRTNIASARAICAYLAGRLADSVDLCAHAEQLLRMASADADYHHRFSLAAARIGALMDLSQTERAEAELEIYIREAHATENINAELHVCYIQTWADLQADRARAAMERLDRQRKQLPRVGFGMLHVLHMAAVMRTGCATGEYDWALDSTREHWQTFQGSVVKRSEIFCVYGYATHARLLLCQAARGGHQRDLTSELSTHRAALKKLKLSNARGELQRIDARIAIARGDRAAAQNFLVTSIGHFESAGARDHAERDRFALGVLQGGDKGKSLQQAALKRLKELGIVAPLRDLRGYYPELLEDSAE
jgi:serine/threonine protein kinase/tetratricopeptide (TPR) repeat protein